MARLLILTHLNNDLLALIGREHDIIHATTPESRATAVAEHGGGIQAVLTMGSIGLTAAEMAAMPRLEFIGCQGVGYEQIDVAAARARGITVCNGAGANAPAVADHAFALLLGVVRAVPRMDAATRKGIWRNAIDMLPGLGGKKFGIVGLGAIGKQAARRAQAFDMEVGYHSRRRAAGVDFAYFDTVPGLAEWADILLLSLPGGDDTFHLVDARVLAALGPRGFLVNVARGSVVDTAALAAALRTGALAGAALDVYESEPAPPAELIDLQNVVLSPHIGSWSPDAMDAMIGMFLENARRHFAGQPVLTPV